MYPAGELTLFSIRKEALRRHIAEERRQCAVVASRIARPIARIDILQAQWRRISPLMKLALTPLVFTLQRRLLRRMGGIATLRRWMPLVAAALCGWREARK